MEQDQDEFDVGWDTNEYNLGRDLDRQVALSFVEDHCSPSSVDIGD